MAKTGLAALKETIDRSKSRISSGSGRLNYFTWKDGDKFTVRFLTDNVITTNFYEWVQTNDGKAKDFISAPDYFGDGREDWMQKYSAQQRDFKSKQLVPARSREMTVGMAVLREEVSKGNKVAVQDQMETLTVDGSTYPSRWFGIVKQPHKIFWNNLMAYYGRYGTICDRDYEISREGAGLDTTYHFVPVYEDPALPDEAAVMALYGYGKKAAEDDPQRFLYVPRTLEDWADYYASEDRAKYWLTPKDGSPVTPTDSRSGLTEFKEATTSNPVEADVQTADEFDALRAKLLANQ